MTEPTAPHILSPLKTLGEALHLAEKRTGLNMQDPVACLEAGAKVYDAWAQDALAKGHPDTAAGQMIRAAELRAWALIAAAQPSEASA